MKVSDCNIDDEYQQVNPNENLSSVRNKYCHFLVVVENNKPIGIVTNNDIIKNIKTKKDYERLKFKDIMSSPVTSVKLDDDMDKISKIMVKNGFMSLPVINGSGDFVGLITYFDYLGRISEKIERKLEENKE